jgi:hypothetical protein
MLVQCPRCQHAFQAAVAPPAGTPGHHGEAKIYGLAEADEPETVFPAADSSRPSPSAYRWVRCSSCGELIPPQRGHCEFCGEPRDGHFSPPRRDVEPHRAALLQFLATTSSISGILSCALIVPVLLAIPLGLLVWGLATHDLAQMSHGLKDRTGLMATQAARKTAIVGLVMGMISGGCWLTLVLWHFMTK